MKNRLSQFELFDKVPQKEKESLERYLNEKSYKKGGYIFHEYDKAVRINMVLEGKVKLVSTTPQGRDVIIHIAIPGEIVDLEAVFDSEHRLASAVAVEDTTLVTIERSRFLNICEQNVGLAVALAKAMSTRVGMDYQRITELSAAKVDSRIANMILRLGDTVGAVKGTTDDLETIAISLSRQDIADLSGTTVESAIRTMRRFLKDSVVSTTRKSIIIQDRKELEHIAQMY